MSFLTGSNQGGSNLTLKGWPLTVRYILWFQFTSHLACVPLMIYAPIVDSVLLVRRIKFGLNLELIVLVGTEPYLPILKIDTLNLLIPVNPNLEAVCHTRKKPIPTLLSLTCLTQMSYLSSSSSITVLSVLMRSFQPDNSQQSAHRSGQHGWRCGDAAEQRRKASMSSSRSQPGGWHFFFCENRRLTS